MREKRENRGVEKKNERKDPTRTKRLPKTNFARKHSAKKGARKPKKKFEKKSNMEGKCTGGKTGSCRE